MCYPFFIRLLHTSSRSTTAAERLLKNSPGANKSRESTMAFVPLTEDFTVVKSMSSERHETNLLKVKNIRRQAQSSNEPSILMKVTSPSTSALLRSRASFSKLVGTAGRHCLR